MAIDFGSGGWDKPLNDFIDANTTTVTDRTNAGIVMLNGFKAADSAGMVYKTIESKNFKILTIEGSIKYPALSSGQALDCLQVPTSAFPVNKDFVYLHDSAMIWGDQLIKLDFDNATGKVRFTNESVRGDKTLVADHKFISLTILF